LANPLLALQNSRSLEMKIMIIRLPLVCQFIDRILFERIFRLIVDDVKTVQPNDRDDR